MMTVAFMESTISKTQEGLEHVKEDIRPGRPRTVTMDETIKAVIVKSSV